MRKVITIFICAALCVSLFAGCGAKSAKGLTVGYGKADISPQGSVPLGGYMGAEASEYRHSTTVAEPFYAICVAFSDGDDNTVLVIAVDLLLGYNADAIRDIVAEATGIPKERILYHSTHNHSGPDILSDDLSITNSYLSILSNGVVAAAKAALEDRKPTQMHTTFSRPEGLNSVRHYLLSNGTGQSYGMDSVPKEEIIGHWSAVDNLLQLVKFTREGAKDIVLVNWQGHPIRTSPITIATPNYAGVMRTSLDASLGCQSIFILGGSGNVNCGSQITEEMRAPGDYIKHGTLLAEEAVEAAKNFTQVNTGTILFQEKEVTLDTSDGGLKKVKLTAFSVGDFAMVAAPFEIFDTNAVAVREASAYKMTFYATCTNGSNGYLPTPDSFDFKDKYEARTTRFMKGTAEVVQEELSGMLADLFAQSGNQITEKPEGYIQGEFVPVTDGITYKNYAPGDTTAYTAVENGFFSFLLIKDSQYKYMLCKDEELIKEILAKETVQLLFDEQNVVVGIVE